MQEEGKGAGLSDSSKGPGQKEKCKGEGLKGRARRQNYGRGSSNSGRRESKGQVNGNVQGVGLRKRFKRQEEGGTARGRINAKVNGGEQRENSMGQSKR